MPTGIDQHSTKFMFHHAGVYTRLITCLTFYRVWDKYRGRTAEDHLLPPPSFIRIQLLLADVSAFFRWPAIDRLVNCPHDGVKLTEIDVQGSTRLRLPRALSMTAKSARLPSLSRPMVAICRAAKDYPRDNDALTKWTIQRNPSPFHPLPRSHPITGSSGANSSWQIDTTPLDFFFFFPSSSPFPCPRGISIVGQAHSYCQLIPFERERNT